MKMIILVFGFLFSVSSFAVNYANPNQAEPITYYGAKKYACERDHGADNCLDVDGKDLRYHDVATQNVDDESKPLYKTAYNSENCDSTLDCDTKLAGKQASCDPGDYAEYVKNEILPGYSLYCMGISGYEQKSVKVLVENSAQKTSVEAADAQEAADKAALAAVVADAAFGQKMIAYVAARVRAKSLSLADTKTTLSEYEVVMSLLQAGSIPHAKTEIESLSPDGTRISQADKDALLAEINAYLGL